MTIDATEQARMIRDGEASPAELVDDAIERLERLNPQLNAVIHPLLEEAREAAAGELPDGPFRGVPYLVKDLSCYMAGAPVHEGMRALKDAGYRADHDMWITQRLRRAGFVILGRTNTPELGILPTTEPVAYGPTHNPWNLDHSTGGSSGGSAASVAAGIVAAAHANDGGGSIRIPASHCGLVGLKPTRARVTLGPDFGDVLYGLVIELAVTRSVRDAAAILDAIHGPGPGDPYAAPPPARPYIEELGADPGRLRIGLMTTPPGGQFETHAECVAAAESAAAALEELGHHVERSHPSELDDPNQVPDFLVRWTAGVDWNMKYWGAKINRDLGADDVEPCTWALAEQGRAHSAADLLRATEKAQASSRRVAAWWAEDGYDLLLTPTCAEPPPRLGEFDAPPDNPLAPILRSIPFATFTAGFNTTGQPAISLPLHLTPEGLPVGVQLVAAFGREDLLLRVASQLEQSRPWADRNPPLHASREPTARGAA
ncbi:MAG TPA: amidase [Solirubrobacteraceae bacterium]|nr:amidase [Solirubrobacteraceae bacterium]